MTVYSLVILPVSCEFLMLPVWHVSERAAPACALSAVIIVVFNIANVASFEVPRFRWLEGIRSFGRLAISDLTADLSLTLHYIFHSSIFFDWVHNILNLLLDLILCLIESILHGITTSVADEAWWAEEPLDRLFFLDDFVIWSVCADILALLSQFMRSVSSVTVLCDTLERNPPRLSLEFF